MFGKKKDTDLLTEKKLQDVIEILCEGEGRFFQRYGMDCAMGGRTGKGGCDRNPDNSSRSTKRLDRLSETINKQAF